MFHKGEKLYHHFLSSTKTSQTTLKKKASLKFLFLKQARNNTKREAKAENAVCVW